MVATFQSRLISRVLEFVLVGTSGEGKVNSDDDSEEFDWEVEQMFPSQVNIHY